LTYIAERDFSEREHWLAGWLAAAAALHRSGEKGMARIIFGSFFMTLFNHSPPLPPLFPPFGSLFTFSTD